MSNIFFETGLDLQHSYKAIETGSLTGFSKNIWSIESYQNSNFPKPKDDSLTDSGILINSKLK